MQKFQKLFPKTKSKQTVAIFMDLLEADLKANGKFKPKFHQNFVESFAREVAPEKVKTHCQLLHDRYMEWL